MESHSARESRFAVFSSYLGMASLAAALNTPPICLTAMADTFGLDEARMGTVAAAVFSGVVLGIGGAGPLGDRFGIKPFLLFGAMLQAAGMLVLGKSPNFSAALGGAFLAGCGGGVLDALLSPFVCALRPREKSRAMNLLHAFYCIGAAVTVGLGMGVLRFGGQWRTLFLAGAVPSVLAFSGLALARPPALPAARSDYVPLRKLLRIPRFYLFLAAMFFAGGAELGPAQWLPAYAERVLDWPRALAPAILFGFSAAMAAGRLSGARISRCFRPTEILIGAALACSLLLFVMSPPGFAPAFVPAGALFGLAVATLWPTTLALTAIRFPGGGAAMFSALGAVGNAGGVLAPWCIGVVAQYAGFHWALASVVLFPLALAASAAVIRFRPAAAEAMAQSS